MLAGCSTSLQIEDKSSLLIKQVSAYGFKVIDLNASSAKIGVPLFSLARHKATSDTLTVYIEGDGAPWINPWLPPNDPTPVEPIALRMATQDPAPIIVYLARPCQYLSATDLATCDTALWTDQRFSTNVVDAYDATLTQLHTNLGTTRIRLVGYSGGGVIATLLASRRSDISDLVTVASPLALQAWTKWHDIDTFPDHSDPLKQTRTLPPNKHWAGDKDRIVPIEIVRMFVAGKGGSFEVVRGYDHQCCWARDWGRLLTNDFSQ